MCADMRRKKGAWGRKARALPSLRLRSERKASLYWDEPFAESTFTLEWWGGSSPSTMKMQSLESIENRSNEEDKASSSSTRSTAEAMRYPEGSDIERLCSLVKEERHLGHRLVENGVSSFRSTDRTEWASFLLRTREPHFHSWMTRCEFSSPAKIWARTSSGNSVRDFMLQVA